jgi:hypothetical protein
MDELPPSIRRQEISGESADTRGMNTLEADVEFSVDGSLKLLRHCLNG